MKTQNNREKDANIQLNSTYSKNNQIYYEMSNIDANSKDDEDKIINDK